MRRLCLAIILACCLPIMGRSQKVLIMADEFHAMEHKLIQYAMAGGDLTLLHHAISSRKRENKDWFHSRQTELPTKPSADGQSAYLAPVTVQIVMSGHRAEDFQNTAYHRLWSNAPECRR